MATRPISVRYATKHVLGSLCRGYTASWTYQLGRFGLGFVQCMARPEVILCRTVKPRRDGQNRKVQSTGSHILQHQLSRVTRCIILCRLVERVLVQSIWKDAHIRLVVVSKLMW